MRIARSNFTNFASIFDLDFAKIAKFLNILHQAVTGLSYSSVYRIILGNFNR